MSNLQPSNPMPRFPGFRLSGCLVGSPVRQAGGRSKGSGGFTLVEVLAATAVLSLGLLFIYEALFTSLDIYRYYSDYLEIAPWAEEKIWQAQDSLIRTGLIKDMDLSGNLNISFGAPDFKWSLSSSVIDDEYGLCFAGLYVGWKNGTKLRSLTRESYVIHQAK